MSAVPVNAGPVSAGPVSAAPASAAPGPSRRRLLVLGSAAVTASALAACTGDAEPPPASAPSPSPAAVPVDPDVALRAAAAARELALLARYDAVLAARPGLSARLQPLRGHHAQHLAALRDPAASPSPTGAAPSPSAAAPPAVPVPADDAAALAALTAAERETGQAHGRDCLAASRPLAAVLGSLSASELSHAVALA